MLPKSARLSSEREIRRTIKAKRYKSNSPLLYLVARNNECDMSRLAVVIPKSIGKSVARNRLRRVLQAAYANIRHKMGENMDIVVFPKKQLIDIGMTDAIEYLKEGIKDLKR